MKSMMIVAALAVGIGAAGVACAQDGAALAKSDGCMNCHAVNAKKVGPSFKESAAKFKGKADAEVVAAIKASKGHADSKASDADLATLAKWIQAL